MASEDSSFRIILKACLSGILQQHEFESAEDAALETLLEMLIAYMSELARYSKTFAEIANRSEPLPTDVFGGMVEMGLNLKELLKFMKKPCRLTLTAPTVTQASGSNQLLNESRETPVPAHVAEYMPDFPPAHTYIRTEAPPEQQSEYRDARERVASQRRDIERSLTNFIARTRDTSTLFSDDPNAFPLISHVPDGRPYLAALLPEVEAEGDKEAEELSDTTVHSITASKRIHWYSDSLQQDSDYEDDNDQNGKIVYFRKPELKQD